MRKLSVTGMNVQQYRYRATSRYGSIENHPSRGPFARNRYPFAFIGHDRTVI
jgi:hypothetical protein